MPTYSETIADALNWKETGDLLQISSGPWTAYNQSLMSQMLYALCKGQRPIETVTAHATKPRPRTTIYTFRDGSRGYFDHEIDTYFETAKKRYLPFRSIREAVPSPEFAARLVSFHAV